MDRRGEFGSRPIAAVALVLCSCTSSAEEHGIISSCNSSSNIVWRGATAPDMSGKKRNWLVVQVINCLPTCYTNKIKDPSWIF